jgi:hypothetical protein
MIVLSNRNRDIAWWSGSTDSAPRCGSPPKVRSEEVVIVSTLNAELVGRNTQFGGLPYDQLDFELEDGNIVRNINKLSFCAGHFYGFISTFRSDAPSTRPGPVS